MTALYLLIPTEKKLLVEQHPWTRFRTTLMILRNEEQERARRTEIQTPAKIDEDILKLFIRETTDA